MRGYRQGEKRVHEGPSQAVICQHSISGQINEGLEGRVGRGHRGLSGGATARCWRRKRMGIKRTQAVIREEFQPSSNRSGVGGGC